MRSPEPSTEQRGLNRYQRRRYGPARRTPVRAVRWQIYLLVIAILIVLLYYRVLR